MVTSSNGSIFHVTGPLCREFTGHRWIPLTKTNVAELRSFFDLRQNKRLGKQSRRRLFETPSRSSWRHCNGVRLGQGTYDRRLISAIEFFYRVNGASPWLCNVKHSESTVKWTHGLIHLTHWGRDEIDAIMQMTFSNAFSWLKVCKMCKFWLRFHWSLFPSVKLSIIQH